MKLTPEMLVETVDIDKVTPYARNPRKNHAAIDAVAASLKEYGFRQPIVVDEEMVVVVGHTRLLAAKKLGYTQVPVHIAKGLTEQQVKAYRIADNKTNEFAEWDIDLLKLELEEVDDLFTGFVDGELDEEFAPEGFKNDGTYTKKIEVPKYVAKGEKPPIPQLVDDTKTVELLAAIRSSNATEEEKDFLVKAAYRHFRFDYHNIAEYYCHASMEVQNLMEQSALVIIDFDKAIEDGYATLSSELKSLYEETRDVEE